MPNRNKEWAKACETEIERLQAINAELLAALEAAQPILKRAAGMAREKLSAPYIVAELERVEEQAGAVIAKAKE